MNENSMTEIKAPDCAGLGAPPCSQISAWFAGKCDGEWEHMYGIKIETTDNPGWLAQIDADTEPAEGQPIKGQTGRVEWEYSEGILIGYIDAADGLPELLATLGDILSANVDVMAAADNKTPTKKPTL